MSLDNSLCTITTTTFYILNLLSTGTSCLNSRFHGAEWQSIKYNVHEINSVTGKDALISSLRREAVTVLLTRVCIDLHIPIHAHC